MDKISGSGVDVLVYSNGDETIEFKDYLWECICPHRGG